jgi:UDP-2,3-diacylglucosamine pyrophosphatase LpxH
METEHISNQALRELLSESRIINMKPGARYLILSDLHLGNGAASDDFVRNSELTLAILEHYRLEGYCLILNGDIEELLRFELADIKRHWKRFYDLLAAFQNTDKLIKLVGNHDIDLLDQADPQFPVEEALRLINGNDSLFIFHGHQMSRRLRRPNPFITFILKYIATPLRIRNYSVSADSARKFKLERTIYQFSAHNRLVSIIGHTHRPLFESMSKIDSLRFEMEQLCLEYPGAGAERRLGIERRIGLLKADLNRILAKNVRMDYRSSLYNASLVVPCLFNSGSAIGKRGLTCIEIDDSVIRLVHWFDHNRDTGYRERQTNATDRLGDSDFYRLVIKEDRLEHIFSRIRLLGG